MTQYKYILDNSSKKYRCPKCQMKTFVLFVDTDSGEMMPDEFGRCDRESKCKYYNTPKSELKQDFEYEYTPPTKPTYHDYELVIASGRNFKINNFVQFLKSIFTQDEVKQAIKRYLIGSTKYFDGGTVFWQIDNEQNVRHGKVMAYDVATGKRSKDANGKALISSVRSIMKLKDFNLKQCLYGLHLINETDCKKIALVEGEKTAIMMSIFKPEYLWMATGSKHGFKYEYLKPLKGFEIVAFPDKGEYDFWQKKALELHQYNLDIHVSSWLEKTNHEEGSDLADVYLYELKELSTPKEVNQQPLTKRKQIASHSERTLKTFANKNPLILEMVKTFDLIDSDGLPLRLNLI